MAFYGIFQTVGAEWTRVLPGCNWHQIAGNLVGILILGIFGGVTWPLVPLLWTKLGDTHFFGWQKRFFAINFWQGWNIGVKPTLNCGIWWGQQTKWGWFRFWAWHLRHSDVTKSKKVTLLWILVQVKRLEVQMRFLCQNASDMMGILWQKNIPGTCHSFGDMCQNVKIRSKNGGKYYSRPNNSKTGTDGNRRTGVNMKRHYIAYPMALSDFHLGVPMTSHWRHKKITIPNFEKW